LKRTVLNDDFLKCDYQWGPGV